MNSDYPLYLNSRISDREFKIYKYRDGTVRLVEEHNFQEIYQIPLNNDQELRVLFDYLLTNRYII